MPEITSLPERDMNLYEQDWLGENLEVWLDAIEDLGVFDMEADQTISFGKNKGTATCISAVKTPNGDVNQVELVVEFTSPGLDAFQLHYDLVTIDSEGVQEKSVYYIDVDDHNLPSQNFHQVKWGKLFGTPMS